MYSFNRYPYDDDRIQKRIPELLACNVEEKLPGFSDEDMIGFIDLTSLEGSDTDDRVKDICKKAMELPEKTAKGITVAAVCFYPLFIRLAKKQLSGTSIRVASVAGAFPAGQSPLKIKLDEVRYAVDEGADEIDMVISRGKLLQGDQNAVFDEIAAMREICKNIHLKVILETGELETVENIRLASETAIAAGADFIKTSTGKVQPAAKEAAFIIMADTVKEHFTKTGKRVGLKPAGGISSPEKALSFLKIILMAAGPEWVDKRFFRIGASRLLDALLHHDK